MKTKREEVFRTISNAAHNLADLLDDATQAGKLDDSFTRHIANHMVSLLEGAIDLSREKHLLEERSDSFYEYSKAIIEGHVKHLK